MGRISVPFWHWLLTVKTSLEGVLAAFGESEVVKSCHRGDGRSSSLAARAKSGFAGCSLPLGLSNSRLMSSVSCLLRKTGRIPAHPVAESATRIGAATDGAKTDTLEPALAEFVCH